LGDLLSDDLALIFRMGKRRMTAKLRPDDGMQDQANGTGTVGTNDHGSCSIAAEPGVAVKICKGDLPTLACGTAVPISRQIEGISCKVRL
jgi:hypothetical protein